MNLRRALRTDRAESAPRGNADESVADEGFLGEQPATSSVAGESLYLLAERGTLAFESVERTGRVVDEALTSGRPLRMYVDTFPVAGITWSRYYLGLASAGLVFVLSKYVWVPIVSGVDRSVSILLLFCLLVCSALYQLYTRVNVVLPDGLSRDAQ
ncbi:hypothetical protein [Halegenticoccus soli]|uniref:hypothetical protein n=1 Tax=Halegenticoccus soli TaxID=1985678 RepID=UPI000C6EB430|nr:hypothetical protein [Halegenticoccus soli]